jgi:NADPH2:quinone reductase
MRALVCNEYGPPEKLAIEEHPDPVPGDGEVLVDIKAAGINFPDVLLIGGNYQVKIPPPFVPGNEAAGIVEAVGASVKRFKAGDRVIITPPAGGFAEKCVLAEKLCLPLPGSMSFEQGAGFTITYATSYHAFRQSTAVRPGETVLVLGAAGGVGITAVEIASALGAKVIAAASSEEKLQFAREAGADQTINYSQTSLRDAVKELTDGRGVDVVYDPVGGELAQMALRSLAWQGRYLVIGFACGDIPEFPANIALLKEASIIGVW